MVTVAGKVPCHYGVVSVFYVKDMALEPVNDSISSFSHILDVVPITFQTINEIIALKGTIPRGVVGFS